MNITLTPLRSDTPLVLSRTGDVLTINGTDFDLSGVTEGAELPSEAVDSPFVIGPVTRTGGVVSLTLALPHGADAPEATRFPGALNVTTDGPIPLPDYAQPSPLDEDGGL